MLKQLAHPFSLLLVGKSGVGKTYLTARLYIMFILLCLHYQNVLFTAMPFGNRLMMKSKRVTRLFNLSKAFPTLPEEENFINSYQPNLLILDDLIQEANSNNQIGSLFLRGSHHRNSVLS